MPVQNSGLNITFNEDSEKYHKYRPRYPQALFDKLVHDTSLTQASRLLEIGLGTGQATEPLAMYGCDITAVELGEALANKARAVLKPYSNVTVITGAYENVDLPRASFDLVYSATAFHWIRPEIRFAKSAELLMPGGFLAVIYSEHVSDEHGDGFFIASKPIYKKFLSANSSDDSFQLPKINELSPRPPVDSSLFTPKSFTAFPVTISYTAHDYAELLHTYSPTIALPAERRKKFLSAIENLINAEFNGSVNRTFAMTLTIAKKKEL